MIMGNRRNKHQFSRALPPTDLFREKLAGTEWGQFVLSLHLYGNSQMALLSLIREIYLF